MPTEPLTEFFRNVNWGNEIAFYELFKFGKTADEMSVSFSFI